MRIRTRLFISCLPTLTLGLLFTFIFYFSSLESNQFAPILAILSLLLTTALSLHFMAGKIAGPIKNLNRSALKIAAGQYGESIEIEGPKELEELTNTLNTMSECLLENINHLKERSYLKEKKSDQRECARFLQSHFLQRTLDSCASDAFGMKMISFPSLHPRGFLIDFPTTTESSQIHLRLIEAKEDGLEGMYKLMGLGKESLHIDAKTPSLSLSLDEEQSLLRIQSQFFPPVLYWSQSEQKLIQLKDKKRNVASGDYLFLMNQGFFTLFRDPKQISDLLRKVLKVFSEDGLDIVSRMLEKEISFIAKRRDLENDLHLVCLQTLNI